MADKRANKTSEDRPGSTNANKVEQIHHAKPEQIQPEQPKADKPEQTMPEQQCAANNQSRGKVDQHTVNTGTYKTSDKLDTNEHNRVSLPGDEDYDGVVTEVVINAPRFPNTTWLQHARSVAEILA
jgi:hypothetical protein